MKKNDFTGLSTYSSKSAGKPLTLKDLEKTVKYLTSKKYLKREKEREEFRANGQIIATRALSMGLITETEYFKLLITININGGLIISKKMYDKIKPAIEAKEE